VKLSVAIGAAAVFAGAAGATPGPKAVHTSDGTKMAKASLVGVSDLGRGWTSERSTSPVTGINFSCTGFAPKQNDLVEIGTATSPNFKGSDIGPFLVQKTSVYENARTVKALWNRAVRPKLVECVAQSLAGLRDRGVEVTINSKESLPIGAYAQRSAGYRVVATLRTSKQRLKTYFDVVLLASNRAITELTISQLQKAPPLKWEQALAKIVARKLGVGGPTA
jgi:hypothetical protein